MDNSILTPGRHLAPAFPTAHSRAKVVKKAMQRRNMQTLRNSLQLAMQYRSRAAGKKDNQ